MNFLVFMACYGKCWQKALDSVLKQVYDKRKVYILIVQDGGSGPSDNTYMINGNNKHLVWERVGQNFASKNHFEGYKKASECFSLSNMDVLVNIDGDDDGLANNSVISRLASIYKNKNVWVTHGSYKRKTDGFVFGKRYRKTDNIRSVEWRASHLRTYRFGLAKLIPEESFKDKNGEWYKVCVDLATMFPIIEMAGIDRTKMINSVLYLYNNDLPSNDAYIRWTEQANRSLEIRNMSKFKRIEEL